MPSSDSNFRRFGMLGMFLFIVVGSSFALQQYQAVYHLADVQPGVLYRDGVRSIHEFKNTVVRVHPKTIVCLIDDREIANPAKPQFKQELDYLQQQGIRVERIPIALGGWPTTENVQHFLAITTDPQKQPVLVHCAQGVRRTGMMVAAYQESILGYNKDQAKLQILDFGHSGNTVNDVRRFIDAYDAKTRTVTATFEPSRE